MSAASDWKNRKQTMDAEWRRLQHIDSRRAPSKVIADLEIRSEEVGMRLFVIDSPGPVSPEGPVWVSADEALALANWILATFGSGAPEPPR